MKPIKMVDLNGQYQKIKPEIDSAIIETLESELLMELAVKRFSEHLASYLEVKHVIPVPTAPMRCK